MRLICGRFENRGAENMTELLTAAQMRAIEQAAIASGQVTGLELMERAGRGVVEAIFEEWPELKATSHRAVVLCGPGNNGGDGFVVARLLKEWGWLVRVTFFGQPDRQPADAARMRDLWLAAEGEMATVSLPIERDWYQPAMWSDELHGGHALVIDALFGTGLTRPLDDMLCRLWDRPFADLELEEHVTVHCVSIDVPSGLCADSGRVISTRGRANHRVVFHADLTVACGFLKCGHMLGEGPWYCEKVVRADLGWLGPMGIGRPDYRNPAMGAVRLAGGLNLEKGLVSLPNGDVRPLAKGDRKRRPEHKYAHGHAFILSGPSGRGGAARLSARGALRIGAGVVTVGCPLDAISENAARLDAVMLRGVADAEVLAEVLEDGRINALCLGPGMGTGARETALIGAALAGARPTVLDADALRAGFFDEADALFGKLHGACVLTPHAGEFARLFPDIAAKLAESATKGPAFSKVDACREAAARAGCVVLFKGPDTVIAAPDGRCAINSAAYDRAAPWLATAGSGDVLAGFITGLMARGFSPFDAACTGAWLHVECALSFGPGLIAEDLPEELPKVFRALGL